MDTTRLILLTALAVVAAMLWQEWQKDYGQPAPAAPVATQPAAAPPPHKDVPEIAGHAAARAPAAKAAPRQMVRVHTDTFDLDIDPMGANIVRAALPKYPTELDSTNNPFVVLENTDTLYYVVQGGVISKSGAPTHESMFAPEQTSYTMAPGQDRLEVSLTWSHGDIKVTKIFGFERGSYLIDVRYVVENHSGQEWRGRSYEQIKRTKPVTKHHGGVYTYTGAVISSPDDRYKKIKFGDFKDHKLSADIVNGWAAMLQHYFITAVLPADKSATYHYYTSTLDNKYYSIGAITPEQSAAPGQTAQIRQVIYIGPKLQDRLASIADGLDLTVDYGILWFIAKPLFWCLKELHALTGNWGFAIILVTVFLKLLFYRLSAAGYRSMAKMRRVQPRLLSLRERYKEDKARLNQAMMELYKEEKINPLGGCFPILIQIPVFISLYWVLLGSIELRHAPFILWIRDLSAADPYWVLPVLMGITMFAQQRLNPTPMDPIQQKVMMALPIVFTVFFGFFPSGLVLYWVINNILSIIQQWRITRNLERAGLSVRQKK
jgi:YidC/Oxa1 family membrane protein insertase